MGDRRFIDVTFPVREVSEISAKEKNFRHGHISTLHTWWARRPLAASRATTYAALVPAPTDPMEREKRRQFIVELSRWENSLDPHILERARRDILEAHANRLSEEWGKSVTVEDIEAGRAPRPRVLDPFAGGGAIPLEALRLGCEVHASDYSPVATLILKATLEYPQKYGRPFEGMREHPEQMQKGPRKMSASQGELFEASSEADDFNPLLEAVRYWGDWVLEEAREELAPFYPPDPDGSIPLAYIWVHTIPCQNPTCRAEIPLIRQFWLAKKAKKKVALHPELEDKQVKFSIVGDGTDAQGYEPWPEDFDPSEGTVSRAVATCLVCGSVVDGTTNRRLFREGRAGQRLVCTVVSPPNSIGKDYRIANESDVQVYNSAENALAAKRDGLLDKYGFDPVPDETIVATPSNTMGGTNRILNYGYSRWGDLFGSRQKLALITFADAVRRAQAKMAEEGSNADFARAVATYLAFGVDRLADYGSKLCVLNPTGGRGVKNTFGRHALPMVWDYAESNPFYPRAAGWPTACKKNEKWIERAVQSSSHPASVGQANAVQLNFPDAEFDAVMTDPPYYDNIPYSYISDYFYVWLKRTLGSIYPDLFATPLAPKSDEIVAYDLPSGGLEAGTQFFEESLRNAFREIHRVLKPQGIAGIVYAHKSTAGWETVIDALLDSNLVATGAWPINTEMRGRLLAQDTASLASSIYVVARKTEREPTGYYNEVRESLRQHMDKRLEQLWAEGIGGADFFIAAIGSAIEVFGKYEQVIDYEGNVVRADRLLEDVRTLATDFAVGSILHNGFAGEVSELTRLYVLWRWEFGEARAPFDEARKLAQSCGVDLEHEWSRSDSFISKQNQYVRVAGPKDRKIEALSEAHELIDVLHLVLRFWEKGQRVDMLQALAVSGFGQQEAFYRVAQAISETLPKESKEKRLLDGFLAGREKVRADVGQLLQQGTLPGWPREEAR